MKNYICVSSTIGTICMLVGAYVIMRKIETTITDFQEAD